MRWYTDITHTMYIYAMRSFSGCFCVERAHIGPMQYTLLLPEFALRRTGSIPELLGLI
jgi:hypothetical protein